MGAAEPGRRAGLVRVGETDAIPQAYGIFKQPVRVDRGWNVYDPDIRDGELLAQFADGGIEEQSRLGNLGIIVKREGPNRMLGIRFCSRYLPGPLRPNPRSATNPDYTRDLDETEDRYR